MGLHVARCYGLKCKATGAFRLTDAVQPQWGSYSNMADTKIATSCGGIIVPHFNFSAAKVYNSLDISKGFGYYFQKKVVLI